MCLESKRLDEQINSLHSQIKSLPEGKIICTPNGKGYKWYRSDGHKSVYIPKSERNLAEQLAIKKYLHKVYLLGEGRLVNLAAGDGHPAEIMDLTFALQALSLEYVLNNPGLANTVHSVPKEIDERVAKIKLQALNVSIDTLTAEQQEYLSSWQL